MRSRAKFTLCPTARACSSADFTCASREFGTNTATERTGDLAFANLLNKWSVNEYAPSAAPSMIARASSTLVTGSAILTRFVPASDLVAAPAARRSRSLFTPFLVEPTPTHTTRGACARPVPTRRTISSAAPVAPMVASCLAILAAAALVMSPNTLRPPSVLMANTTASLGVVRGLPDLRVKVASGPVLGAAMSISIQGVLNSGSTPIKSRPIQDVLGTNLVAVCLEVCLKFLYTLNI